MSVNVEGTENRPRRQRRRTLSSPEGTSTATVTTDDTGSCLEGSMSSLVRNEPQLAAVLGALPSSSKELMRRIERQQDELRLLQEENTRLRAREVEVSALTLRLQQQFAATQSQVDRLKSQVHMELINPVTEDMYRAIESLDEGKRDLLDTVKLGIYRQLGSMRASKDAALQRATEMAAEVTRLSRENKELQQRLKEMETVVEVERQSFRRQLQEAEQRGSTVVELEGKVRDLESRLKNAYIDQEQFLTAKLNASVKTEEATRVSVRLREAEMEAERYKTCAECSEQKLDILKSEYYELKLKNSQRVLELEACLKAAEEKLKTLADLEMESELFISNLAMQSDGQISFAPVSSADSNIHAAHTAPSTAAALSSYESWLALPRSRKLAHSLTVTKRCLQLENKVSALQHDLEFKDKQIARLQVSLEMAREALNNTNSPFVMVERTVERLTQENDELNTTVEMLSEENAELRHRLEQRTADVQVLCRHRKELLRIQRTLQRLGLEGQVTGQTATQRGRQGMEGASDVQHDATRPAATQREQAPDSSSAPAHFLNVEEQLRIGRETEGQQHRSQEVGKSTGGAFVSSVIQINS